MKALTEFTNVDKAALLHQLFPEEIPDLLDFITGMCQSIKEKEALYRFSWDNGLMSFDFWLRLLNSSELMIAQKRNSLIKSHLIFSEQLFSDHKAIFLNHCISVYTTARKHPNPKFTLLVELLIHP